MFGFIIEVGKLDARSAAPLDNRALPHLKLLSSPAHTHSSISRRGLERRPAASSSTIPTCENPGPLQNAYLFGLIYTCSVKRRYGSTSLEYSLRQKSYYYRINIDGTLIRECRK
ncbi:hypothetical protein PR048_022075 [Dryococelus australis]|uniref:Uncharacterized protein n=1 Tax=Dryococelus australis TaxID=614101 RepID=A0ABQ9H002_9NEOP|nr:hypothetical protein PR048_022075 [Dryococelus australis]